MWLWVIWLQCFLPDFSTIKSLSPPQKKKEKKKNNPTNFLRVGIPTYKYITFLNVIIAFQYWEKDVQYMHLYLKYHGHDLNTCVLFNPF